MRLVTKVSDTRPITIPLGRNTENNVTQIAFDTSPWVTEYGSGTTTILLMRPTDMYAAPVLTQMDGNIAYHTLTNGDLQYTGNGKVQVNYVVGQQIKKSAIFNTRILDSLDNSGTAPGPWQSWVDSVTTAAATAVTAKNAAVAAQEAAEESEESAEDSATAAATSETNAAASATSASNSKTAAATSEANAANSASNASSSASSASASATSASGSATSASASKDAAALSEAAAATSETNAAASAAAAAESEDNAADSESAAATSETNAANSATAANESKLAAAASEANASSSESAAASSATAAANSATAAASSAATASTDAGRAETAMVKYPYIDSTTGNWFKWDVTTGAYVNTGVHATGTFEDVDAEVDANIGTPSVDVEYDGIDVKFKFHNIKGQTGSQGEPGEDGVQTHFGSSEPSSADVGDFWVDTTYNVSVLKVKTSSGWVDAGSTGVGILTVSCVDDDGAQMTGINVTIANKYGGYKYVNNAAYVGEAVQVKVPLGTMAVISCTAKSGYSAPLKKYITVDSATTTSMVYSTGHALYGFHISNDSDPSTKITYLNDAVGLTPAHMDFENDEFDYGSWENAFFMPKPCMLKSDGTVDYYLDPDDYSKKLDGTASDVANQAYNGNAMIEWGAGGKIWYKVVPDDDDPYVGDIYISDSQYDSDFVSWSFYDANDNQIDRFYTRIYKGAVISSKLRSISGVRPTGSNTAQNEIVYAKANNVDSSNVEWFTGVFADRVLITILLVLIGKSTNMQDTFGYGNYTGGSSISDVLMTGTMNTKGMFWGKNASGYGVKVFGMENYWADQWEREAGLISVSNVPKYKMTYGTADGSTATGYNTDGSGYISSGSALSGTSGGYITKMLFIDHVGFVPKLANASDSTYYCDGLWFSSGTMYALFGGSCGNELICGAFACSLSIAASYSYWNVGAALSCKPLLAVG